ncbi:hypothetical protein PGT21_032976 [Puccinia graminis f. sp. tritici]|uniref:Uncharacterized protein n=1 Tax=Puccinia graminis f. sp. tritici TaxID=56615 RepID=A0A5B0QK50_PUCGR|nr:hypothetical protein PGT21_031316 [Puccinia graminis f. sp. tritici]KAA1107955.1 hypothetical protein PGTUg99_016124 [Puccinia graminis f. sp. tritici]KAA1113522.1 hypothetical protein PGT21_032976 [Puccinia graminis f. sp. tritici]
MHHSFFTTALLIVSNVLAQDPANTNSLTPGGAQPNPGSTVPAPGNQQGGDSTGKGQGGAGNGNGQPGPKPISLQCSNSNLPFSERELAEMAQLDATTDTKNSTIPDPKTLSNTQTAALCKNETVTAICVLNSCDIKKAPAPVCQNCYAYTPNNNGDDGTIGTVLTPQVSCDDSYNFNKTDTKTPFLCTNTAQNTFACQSCSGQRICDICYDVKDIPASPAPGNSGATGGPVNGNPAPAPGSNTPAPTTPNPIAPPPTTPNPTTAPNPTTPNPTTPNPPTNSAPAAL